MAAKAMEGGGGGEGGVVGLGCQDSGLNFPTELIQTEFRRLRLSAFKIVTPTGIPLVRSETSHSFLAHLSLSLSLSLSIEHALSQ
jgi:hypothetical protein